MEIEEKQVCFDIIFIFLICKELSLDFEEIKKLYMYHSDIFWNFIYFLFPSMKISIKKFESLSHAAKLICNKFKNLNEIPLEENDSKMVDYISKFIKNKYEYNNELYEFEEILEYIDFNTKETLKIILNDGKVIKGSSILDIVNFRKDIKQIRIWDKVFNKTSIYKYELSNELSKETDINKAMKDTLLKLNGK